MSRAALVPYVGGRAGLVVAEDGHVLLSRAYEVGELRPNPNAALERNHAFLRAVEPVHVQALLEQVVQQLLEHHAATLVIEEPRGSGVTSTWARQIGNAVSDAARPRGIAVEFHARVAATPGGDVPALRHAAALLSVAPVLPEVVEELRAHVPSALTSTPPVAPETGPASTPAPVTAGTCIIGFDLGSASMGVTALADALPIEVIHAVTLGVDAKDLDAVVAVAVELAVRMGATRAAIEHGMKFHPPYFSIPEGSTGAQINSILARHRARTASMAEEHAICGELQKRLTIALQAAGIETVTCARESWAHRVVPHHQGGITNAVAYEGLRARCAEGSWERLRDPHQRDAGGVACMWIIEPPARPKRPSRSRSREAAATAVRALLTPEQKEALRAGQVREAVRRHRGDATSASRAAAGCTCTAKHRRTCPIYLARHADRVARTLSPAAGTPLRPDVCK